LKQPDNKGGKKPRLRRSLNQQDALDVSDPCAVDRQRDDQVSYCPDASQIGVVADELAAAVFA